MSNQNENLFKHKSIRDPLYGFIGISEIETKLIDTRVFRRLQRIKQLSHAYVVYPSAIHTRFEHSLGATHIASRMCDELELDNEQKQLVRLAVLLHDMGHGPFSHLFEHVLSKINSTKDDEVHEQISRLIIETDSEIDSILGDSKQLVTALLEKNSSQKNAIKEYSLLHEIVSSSLDADKLDYLRRDSYHIGAAYGIFDLERIIQTIRKTPDADPLLAIDVKGKDALENYRIARYLMHSQVYEHHTRLIADQMFLKALDIAIYEEKVIDADLLKLGSNPEKFLEFYKTLDDESIYSIIMNDKNSKESKQILENIRFRKLLKRACQFGPQEIIHPRTKADVLKMKQVDLNNISDKIADKLKLKHHEIIFHKSNINIKLFEDADILYVNKGKVYDVKESSPITTAKKEVIRFYVFGPVDTTMRENISKEIGAELKIPPDSICQNML